MSTITNSIDNFSDKLDMQNLTVNASPINLAGAVLYTDGFSDNFLFGISIGNGGSFNTGIGSFCLANLSSGVGNCAFGVGAGSIDTGSRNCFFGLNSGSNYFSSESNNICINALGTTGESNKLRLGAGTGTGDQQLNAAYISGIQGITVTGAAVLVSTSDQLGIAVSSRRFKDNIEDMSSYSSDLLKLRPVTFNYNVGDDKSLQSGLIAEEVLEVMPSLVVLDKEGLAQTVKYHDLPALLLNELQKAVKRIEVLEAQLKG